MSNGFLSKRVRKRNQSGITSDRYEFLGLDQTEPDLGDPLVGPSSIGVNPFPLDLGDPYVLVSDGSGSGKRYWTQKANIISGGVVSPGSVSVYDEGLLAPGTNEFAVTKLNFVGSGVTVTGVGTDRADIEISVTDVAVPSGQTGSIGYRDNEEKLQGASDFVFNQSNNRVGIGTTVPTQKLDVIGNVRITNNLSVGSSITVNSLKTNTLEVDKFTVDSSTVPFKITENAVGIGTTNPIATLDVRGNTNITGYTTVSNLRSNGEILTQTLEVGSTASLNSLNIGATQVISPARQLQNITSFDSITTATIENTIANAPNTFVDLDISGIATFRNDIGVSGLTTTKNLQVSGITTLNSLGVTGLTTSRNLTVTGITTVNNFFIGSGSTVSIASSVGIGTTVARYNLDVNGNISFTGPLYLNNTSGTVGQVLLSNGTSSPYWGSPDSVTAGSATSVTTIDKNNTNSTYYLTFVERTTDSLNQSIFLDSNNLAYNPSTNRLGIGTTSPSANLNVDGSTLLNGRNVLSGITTINDTLDINSSGIRYNPSTTRLGIGTTNPGSTLAIGGTITEIYNGTFWNVVTQADVGYGASQVPLNQFLGQLAFLDEYLPPQFRNTEVVTTSTSTVTLDSLDCDFERSARYNVQITCNGQLIGSGSSASSRSVTNLAEGNDYVSGNYTNISLLTTSGTGNDARANLAVIPEATLTLEAIQDGNFAFTQDISGLSLNKPIIFNQFIPSSAAENSRVTSIVVTNSGTNYTSVPNVSVAAPTNNPAIPGVTGIGSTASAEVSGMKITNFTLSVSGIHTQIPTVTFNSPVGVGTTATGIVGFGVSTVVVTNSGFGYREIPSVSISNPNPAGTAATAGVSSIFATNFIINNTGFGYTGTSGANYPSITIQPPTSGTTATAVVNTLGISSYFEISNVGIGYTRPPILTVDSPTGVGTTAIIGCTLGVATFTNILPGSGYTVSPTLNLSPTVSNFSGRVGMGVTTTNIQEYGGSGYTDPPTVEFVPVGGIGTGAAGGFESINPDSPNNLENFVITNPGYGYTVPPIVVISGGGGTGAAVTITELIFTDIQVFNTGFGVTTVPSVFLTPIGGFGNGASASPIMGIGTITVSNFGSGYTSNPSIAVTAIDGITGSGGSVTSLGLGVTSSNITITNPGIGYTFIPTVTFSPPTASGVGAAGSVGVGISQITVTNTGFAYLSIIPSVSFSVQSQLPQISAGAAVSTILTTNVFITNSGFGYTQFDLDQVGIATFTPTGTQGTVGFGVSTISIIETGIGYTSAQAAAVTIDSPIGSGITATASALLGYSGILPGPGYGVTTEIYYIAEKPTSTTLKLSSLPGIGTLTSTNVANVSYAGTTSKPAAFAGGRISNVFVVSPGSGYTTGSIISVDNSFDGGNVGYGFSFNPITVNNFQVSDVMLLQSVGSGNTSADYVEYSTVANEEILGSFSSSILVGTNPQYSANLQFTPTYRDNTIKISRNRFMN